MRTFKRIEAAFRRTPPRTRVSVKLKSAGEEDVGKCCHLFAQKKTPKPESSSLVRCHGLISSHRVTKSLALVVERAPRPVNHCPGRPVVSLRLLGGSRPDHGEPDQEAGQADPQPTPKLLRFPPGGFDFPGLMVWSGWITRGPRTWWRTATLWLALVGWLQGLPPPTSRPTSAGRYPPSQDSTAPVCNNRENPATCPIITNRKPFPKNRLPQQSNMPWSWRSWLHNGGLDTISPDKWEEKDGRTTWRQIFGNKCF